eukprot:1255085-Pyramimonas_sp.AAC.1
MHVTFPKSKEATASPSESIVGAKSTGDSPNDGEAGKEGEEGEDCVLVLPRGPALELPSDDPPVEGHELGIVQELELLA